MNIYSKWLAKYVTLPEGAETLAHLLTSLGLESNVIPNAYDTLTGVVTAEIVTVGKHPGADRLSICEVNDGHQSVTVVCGAPNAAPGQKVMLAKPGAILPNGMKITSSRVRGILSEGMLCAEDELGISDDHSGIMILDPATPCGMTIQHYFESRGFTLSVDLTPNRPDAASHIGIARDLACALDRDMHLPRIELTENEPSTASAITVSIDNPVGCPRYAARIVKGLAIGPSPDWLAEALQHVGIRSINNVVDAANYVLMETGHPLHTFDYREIRRKQIIVRNARSAEMVTTLDGIQRQLNEEILLICDGERPVAIGGIMGLANSEITEQTTDILIESAYFDPGTIRKGSKYLGLQSEASYRFERGADPQGVIFALNRVTALIQELAGGQVLTGIVDNYIRPLSSPRVVVRFQRINQLLGVDVAPEWVVSKLRRIGCEIIAADQQSVTLISPSWRPDLEREVDYIEEVLRFYGMSNIPACTEIRIPLTAEHDNRHDHLESIRQSVADFGYVEVYNNSLVSEKLIGYGLENHPPVRLKNPLSLDMAYLRTELAPGLTFTAQRNIFRRNRDLQLFEIGFIQTLDPDSETHARETLKLAVLVSGLYSARHWDVSPRPSDLFNLKGLLEALAERYGWPQPEYKPSNHRLYQPVLEIMMVNQPIGWLMQAKPEYLRTTWDIEQPLAIMELNLDVLLSLLRMDRHYSALPVYPSVQRDLSIVLDERQLVDDVVKIIQQYGGSSLKEVRFYDLYQGKNIDKGQKSFTFSLVFQTAERTLTDEEVDHTMQTIIGALERDCQARLR